MADPKKDSGSSEKLWRNQLMEDYPTGCNWTLIRDQNVVLTIIRIMSDLKETNVGDFLRKKSVLKDFSKQD